jgi:hypothetical protein
VVFGYDKINYKLFFDFYFEFKKQYESIKITEEENKKK